MKLKGIKLDNFKLVDDRVVPDLTRSLSSLPVNKRIAVQKGKTTGVKAVSPSSAQAFKGSRSDNSG